MKKRSRIFLNVLIAIFLILISSSYTLSEEDKIDQKLIAKSEIFEKIEVLVIPVSEITGKELQRTVIKYGDIEAAQEDSILTIIPSSNLIPMSEEDLIKELKEPIKVQVDFLELYKNTDEAVLTIDFWPPELRPDRNLINELNKIGIKVIQTHKYSNTVTAHVPKQSFDELENLLQVRTIREKAEVTTLNKVMPLPGGNAWEAYGTKILIIISLLLFLLIILVYYIIKKIKK